MSVLISKASQWNLILFLILQVLSKILSVNICNDQVAVNIKIQTGDVLFAGTDSHVGLILRSFDGYICQEYNLDNIGNDRERNSIDEYTICCSKEFVNDENGLSMFGLSQLTRSGKYIPFFADDWFIEYLEVRIDDRILFNYRFHDWTSPAGKLLFGVTKINQTDYVRF